MVNTVSGTIATFKSPIITPIQSLKVYFNPIQAGDGNPSPTNIRTISGRTGIEIVACGRNMYDPEWYVNKTSIIHGITFSCDGDGVVTANGTVGDSDSVKGFNIGRNHLPTSNYYASVGSYSTGIAGHYMYDNDADKRLRKWDGTTQMGFYSSGRKNAEIQIIDNHVSIFGIRYWKNSVVENEKSYPAIYNSIENPDNIIWEPYKGTIYSVDWSSEAGTTYGGYIDLISGELVVTHKLLTIDGQHNWAHPGVFTVSGDTIKFWIGWQDTKFYTGDYCFDCLTVVNNESELFAYSAYAPTTYSNNIIIKVPYGGNDGIQEATTESAEAWLKEHPIQAGVTIKEPIHYQLTPQPVSTLIGRNNIWGINCNNVEATYAFTESLDMIRTRQKVLKGCQIYNTILPPGYKEYEWLETSGSNAKINTGVSGDDTTLKFESAFMPISLVNSYTGIFGNYKTENDNYAWRIICYANTSTEFKSNFYITMGNGSPGGGGTSAIIPIASKIEAVNQKTYFTMTYGQVIYSSAAKSNIIVTRPYYKKQANTNNIAIGALSTGSTGGTTKFHIYRFKIWSHDKLIRDYHPCVRLSDNKAGFYDMVNYTFNPSIGSVDFVAGNDIGGLYVYLDNSVHSAGDFVTVDQNITSNNDFFITGFYDTGSTDAKSYTVTNNPYYPYGDDQSQHSVILFYNDKTGTAVDYKYIGQTYATRTFTVAGRYLICSVYKPNAANFYIYDNTNQRYIVKGSNVT